MQYRNQDDNRLCYQKKTYGPLARGCDNLDICPMGNVSAP